MTTKHTPSFHNPDYERGYTEGHKAGAALAARSAEAVIEPLVSALRFWLPHVDRPEARESPGRWLDAKVAIAAAESNSSAESRSGYRRDSDGKAAKC